MKYAAEARFHGIDHTKSHKRWLKSILEDPRPEFKDYGNTFDDGWSFKSTIIDGDGHGLTMKRIGYGTWSFPVGNLRITQCARFVKLA
jgi:hypothetical protein